MEFIRNLGQALSFARFGLLKEVVVLSCGLEMFYSIDLMPPRVHRDVASKRDVASYWQRDRLQNNIQVSGTPACQADQIESYTNCIARTEKIPTVLPERSMATDHKYKRYQWVQ